jgi:hypothetical protein
VPEIVLVRCQVGPDAPLALVANLVEALQTVSSAALVLGSHQAKVDADRAIGSILREGGPPALLEHARSRELPAAVDQQLRWDDFLDDRFWMDPDYFSRWPGKIPPRARAFLLSGLLGSGTVGLTPFGRLLLQCQADEFANRLPAEPIRLRSLRYANPLEGELLVQAGVAMTGLAVLLGIVRDWATRRRREAARAGAEERIQAAAAADVEDQVETRAALRQLALLRVARGEIDLPEDVLRAVLTDGVAAAIDRLAERDLAWEKMPNPD